MQHHEVPTVFVHGTAGPGDVQYVEERLCAALLAAPAVHYSVLRIDAAVPGASIVEIEVEVDSGIVGASRTGVNVRTAGDASIADFVAHIGAQ
jgi:pimeloyl-ACP methyl ester carboxylesterase